MPRGLWVVKHDPGDPAWSCMVLGDVRWTQMPLYALSGVGGGWLVRWP